MNDRKAVIIFIILSVVLLIGIGLLPKSPVPVQVPASPSPLVKTAQNVYINKLAEDLTEYNTRLIEMKARVAEVQDDMKEEYLSRVENLENIRNLFAVKYGKLKRSSGDVWDDLKVATEEAWSELEFF